MACFNKILGPNGLRIDNVGQPWHAHLTKICRNWPPHTHIVRSGTLGYIYLERIVLDTLSRQDGQGCRKAAWPPEKSFTLLESKPAGYDLQEHGEIQR